MRRDGYCGADYILSRILEDTVGAKINTVLGYPGGSEIDIAVEKGEGGLPRSQHFRPLWPGTV